MLIKDSGGDFEQPEAGTYAAVCYKMIDLGTQTSTYEGRPSTRHQIILAWEIDEPMADGRPFVVSAFYTASLNEKANLRKILESWRGRAFTDKELAGFDLHKIMGQPCMVTLTTNDKGKIKVASVAKLPKGMAAPTLHNEMVYFSLADFKQGVFDSLSDGLKKIICQSPEYQSLSQQEPPYVDDGEPPPDVDEDGRPISAPF